VRPGFPLVPRQAWERPLTPTRVNLRSKYGADLLFAALYNEGVGRPLDLVVPHAVGALFGGAFYTTVAGAAELAAKVLGTGAHVSFGNPAKVQFTQASSFTIVSCFYLTTAGQSFPQILSKDSGIGAPRSLLQWRLNSDKLEMIVGSTGETLGSVTGASTLSIDTRVVAAARRDVAADTLAVFLNGKLDQSIADASTGTWTITDGELASELVSAGASGIAALKVFDFIFGRALSNAEILDIYGDPYQMFEDEAPPLVQLIGLAPAPTSPIAGSAAIEFSATGALSSSRLLSGSAVVEITAAGALSPSPDTAQFSGSATIEIAATGKLFGGRGWLDVEFMVVQTDLAPLTVTFDVINVPFVLESLRVLFDVVQANPDALEVIFDVIPQAVVASSTDSDLQAPIARVTL
jgi:hypothetical protein